MVFTHRLKKQLMKPSLTNCLQSNGQKSLQGGKKPSGLGWLEVGIQDETDNDEMIYSRYESWRNLLWDSAAIESDLSDARVSKYLKPFGYLQLLQLK